MAKLKSSATRLHLINLIAFIFFWFELYPCRLIWFTSSKLVSHDCHQLNLGSWIVCANIFIIFVLIIVSHACLVHLLCHSAMITCFNSYLGLMLLLALPAKYNFFYLRVTSEICIEDDIFFFLLTWRSMVHSPYTSDVFEFGKLVSLIFFDH
jgi:hypothetical protein